MIRVSDASLLALTKLKTRRIRLAITLLISSVLFCLLLAAAFTVQGGLKSIDKFRASGFSNKYIVSSFPANQSYNILSDPALIAQAKDLQKQATDKKKAEAKRLGIEYDPATDQQYINEIQTGPSSNSEMLNTQIPEVAALVNAKLESQPGNTNDFKKITAKYGSLATYYSVNVMGGATSSQPNPPYISPLKNGEEDLTKISSNSYNATGIDSLSGQWQLFSNGLLKPFLLPKQSLHIGQDGSIPIVAPYSAIEQVLNLKSLPASSSSDDQLARLKLVRNEAAGHIFDICYRNSTSSAQIQQAIQQQQEIDVNKTKKDYKLPDLVYGLPTQACGPVVITRDVRSADQKKQDANQALFKKEFGQADPASQIMHLRIVGINADPPSGNSVSVTQIFQSILVSSLGQGWASPIELTANTPALADIFGIKPNDYGPGVTRYAELSSSNKVEKLLDEQSCQPDYRQQASGVSSDPYKKCTDEGKYFLFSAFGSSSVAIDQFKKGFNKVFLIAGLAVSVVAALILIGTIGRIIADSRRETAVFRAIGAKRLDIAQIYLIYVLFVALLIAIISNLLGYLISLYINGRYSPPVTVDALLAFNVNDLNQKFSLTSFDIKDVAYVAGLIVAAALLASLLPLITNLRRNPIRDMRDER